VRRLGIGIWIGDCGRGSCSLSNIDRFLWLKCRDSDKRPNRPEIGIVSWMRLFWLTKPELVGKMTVEVPHVDVDF
jgi:hypothetical protein